jgi:hypothetical protein
VLFDEKISEGRLKSTKARETTIPLKVTLKHENDACERDHWKEIGNRSQLPGIQSIGIAKASYSPLFLGIKIMVPEG